MPNYTINPSYVIIYIIYQIPDHNIFTVFQILKKPDRAQVVSAAVSGFSLKTFSIIVYNIFLFQNVYLMGKAFPLRFLKAHQDFITRQQYGPLNQHAV